MNTFHKQAVRALGCGLRATAWATDGVIEGIEDASRQLYLGVQWHPERISTEPEHQSIFKLLVDRSR